MAYKCALRANNKVVSLLPPGRLQARTRPASSKQIESVGGMLVPKLKELPHKARKVAVERFNLRLALLRLAQYVGVPLRGMAASC